MKLLLTTIRSECPETELPLKYLNSIFDSAPVDTVLKFYDEEVRDCSIFEEIVTGGNNIIYFQCDEFNEGRIVKLAELLKKADFGSVIVLGGRQLAYETEAFMLEHPYVDFVIRGEVEMGAFDFLRNILTQEFDFESVPGLAFRTQEGIVINEIGEGVQLEDLPFIYEINTLEDNAVVYYESMRGTTDITIFTQKTGDTDVRILPIERVCTELRYFLARRAEKVIFLDKWVNFNEERAYRLFEFLISNDNGYTTFVMDVDGDNLDEDTVRLLSEARKGLFEFNIEIGSTNAETLAAMGRRENVFKLLYNVTKLLQAGTVKVNPSITAGLPTENERLFARSFNKVYGLVDGRGMSVKHAEIRTGSAAAENAEKLGYLYCSKTPNKVISTDKLTAIDLIHIKNVVQTADLYSSDGFGESLKRIMNDLGMKPYTLFSAISDYVESQGLRDKLQGTDLYRVLYNCACGLYDPDTDSRRLKKLTDVLMSEMSDLMPEEVPANPSEFEWEIEGANTAQAAAEEVSEEVTEQAEAAEEQTEEEFEGKDSYLEI